MTETDYTEVYVQNNNYKTGYTITNEEHLLIHAEAVCTRAHSKLPEIKTLTELQMIRSIMRNHSIDLVPAGVVYFSKEKELRYKTNNKPLPYFINKLQYVADKVPKEMELTPNSKIQGTYSESYAYAITSDVNRLVMLQTSDETKSKIICQNAGEDILNRQRNDFLLKITSHICKKDLKEIKESTRIITREASLFEPHMQMQGDQPYAESLLCERPPCQHCDLIPTIAKQISQISQKIAYKTDENQLNAQQYIYLKLLNLPDFRYSRIFANQHHFREAQDQHIAQTLKYIMCEFLLPVTTPSHETDDLGYMQYLKFNWTNILEDTRTFLETIRPPLKRSKRVIGTGVALGYIQPQIDELKRVQVEQLTYILNNTMAIQALTINQEEIRTTYDLLAHEVKLIRNISRINEFAIATLMHELDAKRACDRLHTSVQTGLLKLANAMAMALQGKISPYVLGEKELDAIATVQSRRKIYLSNNIAHVAVQLHKTDSDFIFVLSVPIMDSSHMFRLYYVKSIPIFNPQDSNEVISIIPDTNYIGISTDTIKYINFDENEFHQCTKTAFCHTTSPIETITKDNGCTATSYRNKEIDCPSQKLPTNTKPYFSTYDNITFYSTSSNYTIEIICPNSETKNPIIGKRHISGMGTLSVDPSCFLDTLDGRIVQSHKKPDTIHDLGVSTLEEAIRNVPQIMTFTEQNENNVFKEDFNPKMNFVDVDHMTMSDIMKTVYKPQAMVSHALRTFIIVIAFAITFIIIACCFPQVRAWAKACCFINNPSKYWRKYKNYDVPGFNKIPTFVENKQNKMKAIFKKGGMARYNVEREERKLRKTIIKNNEQIQDIFNQTKAAATAKAQLVAGPIINGPPPIPTAPVIQNNAPITFTTFKPQIHQIDTPLQSPQTHWREAKPKQ
jgi:hypothetical protein